MSAQFEDKLDAILARFGSGDPPGAFEDLWGFASAHFQHERDEALQALCDKLDDIADHQCTAMFATAAGALVENGASATPLARALLEPLRESMRDAARLLERAPSVHEEGGEFEIGGSKLTRAALDEIAHDDIACVGAWFSLAQWFKPVVAAWTRDTRVLREFREDADLRDAVAALGSTTETSHWVRRLLGTVVDERLVVVFPELGEAWSLVADGVVEIGQLSVLLAKPLADPIDRIGATSQLADHIVEVMRGNAEQESDGMYSCKFHLYLTEAIDPADGLPKDGRHRWEAPGGAGDHSLPPDYLVGDIAPRGDTRVLAMVGPRAPGAVTLAGAGKRFFRAIPAVRMFDPLRASVDRVERLPASEVQRWSSPAR
jgi:hypothetical protein